MIRRLLLLTILIPFTLPAQTLDWSKITHWVGSGENKAALVVQFYELGEQKSYVWGYRWNEGDEQPTGESMFRAIASGSKDLYLFTQYTGWMGSTVCGIGVNSDGKLIKNLWFDFENACNEPRISFDYYSPNTGMGQTSAPMGDTPELCAKAIDNAAITHIIDHPLNQKVYGYAAYDYDFWKSQETSNTCLWNAGWYLGYWSYWVGTENFSSLGYSGLGMSSVKISNGDVNAWKYTSLSGGSSYPWFEFDYDHDTISGIDEIESEIDMNEEAIIYDVSGVMVGKRSINEIENLLPGLYIVKIGNKSFKQLVK